jgi:hypothetical protein
MCQPTNIYSYMCTHTYTYMVFVCMYVYIYIYINPLEGVQMHARIQLVPDLFVKVRVLSAGTEKCIDRAVWDGIGRAPWPLGRSIADTG